MDVVVAGMRLLCSACALWLWVADVAACAPAARLQQVSAETGRVELTPDKTLAYQIAMGRYEGELLVRRGGALTGPLIPPAQSLVWTWGNGSELVQRLAQNLFRLTGNDCLSHFCKQVSCIEVAWPVFQCSDDRRRKMSAPDAETVVFGGVTYKRITVLP